MTWIRFHAPPEIHKLFVLTFAALVILLGSIALLVGFGGLVEERIGL